ncbi:MAG: TIGR03013 family XrtA/PEP-CTERM system glycosyltransferase [Steroidobacteraceae bacterium]
MGLFAAFCIASMLLAVSIQLGPYGVPTSSAMLFAVEFALITTAVGTMFGLFRGGERRSLGTVFGRTLLAMGVGVPICYVLFGLEPQGGGLRAVLPYAALFTLSLVILVRPILVVFFGSSLGTRRTLIIGTGADAVAVEDLIEQHGAQGAVVVGFYPAGPQNGSCDGTVTGRAPTFPSDLKLQAIVERFRVNEVIVAAREQRGGALPMSDLLECRVAGVPVSDLSAFYERVRGEVPVDSLKASWLIYGDGFVQSPLRRLTKRSFDLITATVLLILALPVLLFAMLAIFVESGLPIFFTQERVGRCGRAFKVLKLRSMRHDAERDGIARWAQRGDTRVTDVGRVLRKLRIDELPQLVNVLNGDMSLVGPRPERQIFVDQLRERVRFYDLRHSVKPGITGWAQIRYSYGASVDDAQRKLQFDLFYVKNNSLVLDLLILAETVRVVLFGEGAH